MLQICQFNELFREIKICTRGTWPIYSWITIRVFRDSFLFVIDES